MWWLGEPSIGLSHAQAWVRGTVAIYGQAEHEVGNMIWLADAFFFK